MPLLSAFSRVTSFIIPSKSAQSQSTVSTTHGRQPSKCGHKPTLTAHKVITGRVAKPAHSKRSQRNKSSPKEKHDGEHTSASNRGRSVGGDTTVDGESKSDLTANEENPVEGRIHNLKPSPERSLLQQRLLEGWSADELWVYEKLENRGAEPLMPELWQWDFPSFPDILFTNIPGRAFIKNLLNPVTEAVDAFAALVDTGARWRDLKKQGRHTEALIAKGVERYTNWSLRDGQLQDKQSPPCTITCIPKPGESAGRLVNRATEKLKSLGRQWRDQLEAHCTQRRHSSTTNATHMVPTLYAFVVYYSVVSILSYDASIPDAPTRLLVKSDNLIEERDVYNAFAISIVCVHARNHLLQLESKGLLTNLHPSIEDADA